MCRSDAKRAMKVKRGLLPLSLELNKHCLDFSVVLETVLAQLAAKAGRLVASERRSSVERV